MTFDFRSEPYEGSSNGLFTLHGDALNPATFTSESGRTIEILTFLSGGSVQGYALDTFGSGPWPHGNTQLFGQRSYFYFGNNSGPSVDYRFGSAVKLVSATFVLYNPSQNLQIFYKRDGTSVMGNEQFFFTTDAYDDLANNAPAAPPEKTVHFDNTYPLVDQIAMRSLGQSGVALKTLVIDDPAFTPVPEPTSLAVWGILSLAGLGVVARRGRQRQGLASADV
ncbi:hypothetical protein NG895_02885 [Aeoliella sp. ICT_H6.2]|uniref:PEP-CTERM protein-sorting domain-containing protein n=1 Tax=Aeoliella straminimaris TaxID=2954799 RepID=A0A9X2FAQ5_9BACT|nr:hypothetical protein [Aeoliella straminimaris]MCO6042844.1 hypothetical protein [Aeoliella straminimaris]